MRAIVCDFSTDIIPTDEEVKEICKPGAGADTCSWLTMTSKGWSCVCLNRPWSLVERRNKGEMNAVRDGCDKVNNFSPSDVPENEWSGHEF